jgi:hypothetical protein
MTGAKDFYTWFERVPITLADDTQPSGNKQIGMLLVEYQAHRFVDVRNLAVKRGYHLTCVQRVIIPNDSFRDFGAQTIDSYAYPAMVISEVQPIGAGDLYLIDYAPKTLNSALTTSRNNSVGDNVQSSTEHTSGSSTSETNTWEVSSNIGFFGGDLTGGVSAGSSSSTTHEYSTSDSTGASRGSDVVNATSDTMSIKDWGSYASVDNSNQSLRWFWGQQHPWDVFMYHNIDKAGDIALPASIECLLYDKGQLFPPSQLSLFGVNLVSKASWLCLQRDGAPDEAISFKHKLITFTGRHGVDGNGAGLTVRLDVNSPFSWESVQLDLDQLALDPLPSRDDDERATVGFVRSQFTYFEATTPPGEGDQFSIRSPANNLLITGRGFSLPESNDLPMTAMLSGTESASLTLFFKVPTESEDVTLYLKHWKKTDLGCTIRIAINDNPAIVRHVDSFEAGSGTDNILRVMLRNTNYASPEFYDYIVMGVNKVVISISADLTAPQQPSEYAIRAVAIA